jgi:hypothetical protein
LRRKFKPVCLVAIILLAVFVLPSPASAQSGEAQYFPETGFTVRGPFLEFFRTTGGLKRYGYPITDEYVDSQSGLLIQYFQNARMEWHPGNPDPYKVQLGLLGDELGLRQPPIPVRDIPSPADPGCQYFPETGHKVCYKFLGYWRETGGLDMYGYPIAGVTVEPNGRIVQYFQRAKMEWHPGPEYQRIVLAPLGQIYCDYAKLDCGRRPGSFGLGSLSAIRARASVLKSNLPDGDRQTGFVYVTDQSGKPLSGAGVTLVVHYPHGDQAFTLRPTNANGITAVSFVVGPAKPGALINMEFIIYYSALVTRTRTSFLLWHY